MRFAKTLFESDLDAELVKARAAAVVDEIVNGESEVFKSALRLGMLLQDALDSKLADTYVGIQETPKPKVLNDSDIKTKMSSLNALREKKLQRLLAKSDKDQRQLILKTGKIYEEFLFDAIRLGIT